MTVLLALKFQSFEVSTYGLTSALASPGNTTYSPGGRRIGFFRLTTPHHASSCRKLLNLLRYRRLRFASPRLMQQSLRAFGKRGEARCEAYRDTIRCGYSFGAQTDGVRTTRHFRVSTEVSAQLPKFGATSNLLSILFRICSMFCICPVTPSFTVSGQSHGREGVATAMCRPQPSHESVPDPTASISGPAASL
jgi:hypothetical protein